MKTLKLIIAGVLISVLTVLTVQNLALAQLRFLAWDIALPIAVPVILAYFLGAGTGRYLFRFLRSEHRDLRDERRTRKHVKARDEYRRHAA